MEYTLKRAGVWVLIAFLLITLTSCCDHDCVTCVTEGVSQSYCPEDTATLNEELGTIDPLTFDEIINLFRNFGADCN